jgi:hypothetical protein
MLYITARAIAELSMQYIDKDNLTTGARIYYRYSQNKEPIGPVTVLRVFGSYEGRVAQVTDYASTYNLALKDDDHFGELLIWT